MNTELTQIRRKIKYTTLIGLKGKEYQSAWRKLNPQSVKVSQNKIRQKNGYYKLRHVKDLCKYGCSQTTEASRRSQNKATMSRQLWGLLEDEVLMSGKHTESELVIILGRSIRSIQRRKWRIRNDDSF